MSNNTILRRTKNTAETVIFTYVAIMSVVGLCKLGSDWTEVAVDKYKNRKQK